MSIEFKDLGSIESFDQNMREDSTSVLPEYRTSCICEICGENEVSFEVVDKNHSEKVCQGCFVDPDYKRYILEFKPQIYSIWKQ